MKAYENIQRPKLAFYHPSPRGTGCAMTLELHPAHDVTDGSIFLKMANQKPVVNDGNTPTFPTFDWEHPLVAKLSFCDLAMMLQVFRGECESINEGKGLYHRSTTYTEVIQLDHRFDPAMCYQLKIHAIYNGSGEEREAIMHLNNAEALGICEAIATSLALVGFGLPVVPRTEGRIELKDAASGAQSVVVNTLEEAVLVMRRTHPDAGIHISAITTDAGGVRKVVMSGLVP